MTKMFLSMMLIMLSFLMFFLNNPLSMGLLILIQTLITCILSGMMIKTYWFSYILFITFLGGLLVLFIYVSSIASNEMFKFSIMMKIMITLNLCIMISLSFLFYYNISWMNLTNNSEMENFFSFFFTFFNNEYKINISKLYNNQTFLMMMLLIIYLFITLIAVVKITNIFFGPLRTSI